MRHTLSCARMYHMHGYLRNGKSQNGFLMVFTCPNCLEAVTPIIGQTEPLELMTRKPPSYEENHAVIESGVRDIAADDGRASELESHLSPSLCSDCKHSFDNLLVGEKIRALLPSHIFTSS